MYISNKKILSVSISTISIFSLIIISNCQLAIREKVRNFNQKDDLKVVEVDGSTSRDRSSRSNKNNRSSRSQETVV